LIQRRIVRTLGGFATSSACRFLRSRMIECGDSPFSARRSASARSVGQEYEPGQVRPRRGTLPSAVAWASSALERRVVMQPAADQAVWRVSMKSRPERLRWNDSLA